MAIGPYCLPAVALVVKTLASIIAISIGRTTFFIWMKNCVI